MSWTVYILQSDLDGRLYKGCTEHLGRRLAQHNAGSVRSTKAYRPWRRVHAEPFADKAAALRRERFLKSRSGHRWLNAQPWRANPAHNSPRRHASHSDV